MKVIFEDLAVQVPLIDLNVLTQVIIMLKLILLKGTTTKLLKEKELLLVVLILLLYLDQQVEQVVELVVNNEILKDLLQEGFHQTHEIELDRLQIIILRLEVLK